MMSCSCGISQAYGAIMLEQPADVIHEVFICVCILADTSVRHKSSSFGGEIHTPQTPWIIEALNMNKCGVFLVLCVIFINTLQCQGFVNPEKREKETGECRTWNGKVVSTQIVNCVRLSS